MSERRLSGIELFAFDVVAELREPAPRKEIRRYGLLKLSCGESSGFGVCLISEGFAPADLVRWGGCLRRLRGLTPGEAASAFAEGLGGLALADLRAELEARRAGARMLLGGLAAQAAQGAAAAGRAKSGGYAPHPSARRACGGVRQRGAAGRHAAAAARGRGPAPGLVRTDGPGRRVLLAVLSRQPGSSSAYIQQPNPDSPPMENPGFSALPAPPFVSRPPAEVLRRQPRSRRRMPLSASIRRCLPSSTASKCKFPLYFLARFRIGHSNAKIHSICEFWRFRASFSLIKWILAFHSLVCRRSSAIRWILASYRAGCRFRAHRQPCSRPAACRDTSVPTFYPEPPAGQTGRPGCWTNKPRPGTLTEPLIRAHGQSAFRIR
ncbi:hypothetical protein QWJ34_17635 [Saccharibacillus sp. CPCC 101409]|uniref:hypothetical protein n=1 Tax=Saccharibacillus sp. CPCC 101409 TaxID=3058041 RepID=UPI00267174C2|nr:hypothetical protein [Saccharibacillus sp. CPCC 101409]MDO3411590.1 hypothetical protein [Saccharibacillus sp. CPCC 101409]